MERVPRVYRGAKGCEIVVFTELLTKGLKG